MSPAYKAGFAMLAIGLVLLLIFDSQGSLLGLDNSSFARLVALGALVVVIGAAAIGRSNAGTSLRQIAVWLAILLVLVAGYQYRFDLQSMASQLTGGLVRPPPPAPNPPGGIDI